jgi:RNA polymerase sigma-70 factor (sigma-E family)
VSTDGDKDFEAFVVARGEALLRHAYLLCGDPHWAQDLLQDALIKTHARWRRVSSVELPDAYVRQVVLNTFLSRRRRRANGEVPVASLRIETVATDAVAAFVERDAMWSRLATLPRQQRAAVVLRFYEDLDDRAIASALACSPATVRKHIQLALRKLRPLVATDIRPRREEQEQHG